MAMKSWIITAFRLSPINFLIHRFCFNHLNNSSIDQRAVSQPSIPAYVASSALETIQNGCDLPAGCLIRIRRRAISTRRLWLRPPPGYLLVRRISRSSRMKPSSSWLISRSSIVAKAALRLRPATKKNLGLQSLATSYNRNIPCQKHRSCRAQGGYPKPG